MDSLPSLTIPDERIVNQIHVIRGKKVILDSDLAELYGVETKALNRAVKRNQKRFPGDFMFKLSHQEIEDLRYQNGTSKGSGGRRYSPNAFTEHGVAMLSSVLRSDRAIHINLVIIRAFIRMREILETNETLRAKLNALERELGTHNKQIREVYAVLQRLLAEPKKPKHRMGF